MMGRTHISIKIFFSEMEKPDLLVQIQKLQLSLDQEKEQRLRAEAEIEVKLLMNFL